MPRMISFLIAISFISNISFGSDSTEIKDTENTLFIHQSPYSIYNALGQLKPDFEVFEKAYQGFLLMSQQDIIEKNILTIIDYALSSTEKRLWVIDLNDATVLYNELVAHGMQSGTNYANKFSNVPESHMSSLGFYATGETYHGKHGLSLFIDGMEPGINDNARDRAVVIHGADYVSPDFIRKFGRLGRSYGCPALSYQIHEQVIETIANQSCVFIHGKSVDYNTMSRFIQMEKVESIQNISALIIP